MNSLKREYAVRIRLWKKNKKNRKKSKKNERSKNFTIYATSRVILVKLFEFIETEKKLDWAVWTRIQSYEMCHWFQIFDHLDFDF